MDEAARFKELENMKYFINCCQSTSEMAFTKGSEGLIQVELAKAFSYQLQIPSTTSEDIGLGEYRKIRARCRTCYSLDQVCFIPIPEQ